MDLHGSESMEIRVDPCPDITSILLFHFRKNDELSLFRCPDIILHQLENNLRHIFAIQGADDLQAGVELFGYIHR